MGSQIGGWSLMKKHDLLRNEETIILERMEALHLIERLHGKLGWAVLPECIENMSDEAIKFLGSYGHTEATINSALLKKSNSIANI